MDCYAPIASNVENQGADCSLYIRMGIFSTLLVSLCWWENPLQAANCMQVCLSVMILFCSAFTAQITKLENFQFKTASKLEFTPDYVLMVYKIKSR